MCACIDAEILSLCRYGWDLTIVQGLLMRHSLIIPELRQTLVLSYVSTYLLALEISSVGEPLVQRFMNFKVNLFNHSQGYKM